MNASIGDDVRTYGFAFRTDYCSDLTTEAVAGAVGVPVALGSKGAVHVLTPASENERLPNSYSGLYGFGPFPMHTDLAHHRLPPRYFMLRCCIPAKGVGTTLIDSTDILATVGTSLLSRALVQPRRPRAGVRPLLRLFDPAHGLFRWDIEFLRPASDAGKQAVSAVADALEGQERTQLELACRGDLLVIDNWRMVHGRTAVTSVGRCRRIDRVYLGKLH